MTTTGEFLAEEVLIERWFYWLLLANMILGAINVLFRLALSVLG